MLAALEQTIELPHDEVRAAVDRIVSSDMLQQSPQLAAFLRLIVKATLRGEAGRIKGYTIAIEGGFKPGGCGGRCNGIIPDPAQRMGSSSSFRAVTTFRPSVVA